MVAYANSLGPYLIGVVLDIALYGVLVMQCLDYHLAFKSDPKWLKCVILFVLLVSTTNTMFDVITMYDCFITDFANPAALAKIPRFAPLNSILTAIVTTAVQLFFGLRVKRFTGNNWIFAIIIVLTFTQLMGGLGSTIGTYLIESLADLHKLAIILNVWIFSALVNDVLITSSLAWYLYNSRIGIAATDDLINKILIMVIQTGLLTTIWAMIDATLYFSLPSNNNAHLMFTFSLSILYANSFVSSLNARSRWERKAGNLKTLTGPPLSSVRFEQKGGPTMSLAPDSTDESWKHSSFTRKETTPDGVSDSPDIENTPATIEISIPGSLEEKDKIVDEIIVTTPSVISDIPEMEFQSRRRSEESV